MTRRAGDDERAGGPRGEKSAAADTAFVEAVLRYLDGESEPDETQRLLDALRHSGPRRHAFVRICRRSALLRETLRTRGWDPAVPGIGSALPAAVGGVAARSAPACSPGGSSAEEAWPWSRGAAAALAVAATVVLTLAVLLVMRALTADPAAGWPADRIAVIESRVGFAGDGGPLGPDGGGLVAGQRLGTPPGAFVRIQTRSGAALIVSGSTDLLFRSGGRVRLERGSVTATVPPRAVGFTVETPGGEVVDLGTQFAVEVDARGSARVRVIEGRVRLDPVRGGGSSRDVSAGGSARITEAGWIEPVDDTPTPVVDALPASRFGAAVLSHGPWAYLDFDRPGGVATGLATQGRGSVTGREAAMPLEPGGPVREPGQHLRFTTGDDAVVIPGAAPHPDTGAGYTIGLWLRADQLASQNVLTATGQRGPDHEFGPQLRTRPDGTLEHLGPRGMGVQRSEIRLKPGQWRFVAITLDADRRMGLYVDGEPVGRPATAAGTVDGRLTALALSGPAGRRAALEHHLAGFAGSMDEVFVLPRALGPDEMRRLFEVAAR